MFIFFKKFYYFKKAQKPLNIINKYSSTIAKKFDILDTEDTITFFHSWLHVIYCVIFNPSSQLELTISLFFESHLSRFMSNFEVKKCMKLRYDFINDILSQVKNFINEPTFIPMMAEVATDFLIEENLILEENRDVTVDSLMHYEFLFINEFKKR